MKARVKTALREALRWDWGAFVFAIVSTACCMGAGCIALGRRVMGLSGAAVLSWITPGYAAVLVVVALVLAAVLYCVAALIFRGYRASVDKRAGVSSGSVLSYKKCLKKYFWVYALVIFACWTPWIIAHLPGTYDQDTIWQALIYRNPACWYDHHPWFTTALFGGVLDAGVQLGSQSITLMLYTVFQAVFTAGMFSCLFCYLKRFTLPTVLFRLCFIVVCAFPVYASFASQMVKDSLFALAWIPFMIMYVEAIRTRGACLNSLPRILLFIAAIVLALLSRKTGIYLIAPALLVLVFFVAAKWRIRWSAVLVVVVAFSVVWSSVLLPSFGVAKGPSKELYSCPLQQTARYVALYPDEVTEAEKAAIDGVLPYDSLWSLYQVNNADAVKDSFKSPSNDKMIAYFAAWAGMGLKHPLTYATATLGTNEALFLPLVPYTLKDNFSTDLVDENVRFFTAFTSGGLSAEEVTQRSAITAEGLTRFSGLDGVHSVMATYEKAINYTPLRVLNSPSFMAFYIPLLLGCFLLSFRSRGLHRWRIALALIPAFLLVASLVVGPLVLARYCIPAAYVMPLLVALPWIMGVRTCSAAPGSVDGKREATNEH